MNFTARYTTHTLRFKFPAGTSRGVMHEKKSWYIRLSCHGRAGVGEAGPLPGLSIDNRPDFEEKLRNVCGKLEQEHLPASEEEVMELAWRLCGQEWPSIRFAVETALLDWLRGGKRMLFDNTFWRGEQSLPINGLIWMGEKEKMRERLQQKLAEGYSCLKMKIGAIDFEEECALLEEVRQHFSASEITLRVDANGAFSPAEAPEKLQRLSVYDLHSIEQPVKAGQPEVMRELCKTSPVPVALDEELIGVSAEKQGAALLNLLQPPFIILKPSLLGGMAACRRWIELAEERSVGWWITSALESDIGLNAISQFTANYRIELPQGLGTGQLYHNNIPSPLAPEQGKLRYNHSKEWDLMLTGL